MQEKLQTSLLEVGDYLDIGWSEFSKNFQAFAILTLIVNVPIALMGFFISLSVDPLDSNSIGIFLLFIIVSIVLGLLSGLALPKIIERSIRGQKVSVFSALQNSLPQIFIGFIVSLIISLIVGLGFIALLIPGIWIAVHTSFTIYAIALRGCGFNALTYSYSLVRGRWWSVFGRMLLLFLYFFILFLIIFFALGIIGGIISLVGLGVVAQLGYGLIGGLIGYYANTLYTILFLNLDYTRHPIDNPSPEISQD